MNIDIYLIEELSNTTIHFPVNPLDKLSAPRKRRYRTEEILNIGQVDIKQKGDNIQEISFNSLFPVEYDDSYCVCQLEMTPQEYMNKINEWVDSEDDSIQLRLIIAELNINKIVNVSEFTPEVRGGEIGDIYFSITFRTYQPLIIGYIDNSESSYQGGLTDYGNRYFGNDEYSDGDTVKIVIQATVYEEDSQNSTALGYAYVGEEYEVYSVWGEWLSIYWGDHGGYVHKGFVTKV